jgi:hypothetical protein
MLLELSHEWHRLAAARPEEGGQARGNSPKRFRLPTHFLRFLGRNL